MLKKLLIAFTIILTTTTLIYSQSGTLKGVIKDQTTKDPIPFVNIVIELGGKQLGGTTTDFDGNYTIKPIPPGKYDVKATFVGFKPLLIKGVIINASTGYKKYIENATFTDKSISLNATIVIPIGSDDYTNFYDTGVGTYAWLLYYIDNEFVINGNTTIYNLYSIMPENISLIDFNYDDASRVVRFRGRAYKISDVFKLVSLLENSSSFSNVQTRSVAEKRTRASAAVDFQISCNFIE